MKSIESVMKDYLSEEGKHGSLKTSERILISNIYRKNDKKYVRKAKLTKTEKQLYKKLFIELHVSFYENIIQGPNYIKVSRLVLNFLYLRAKENLRLVLSSYRPYNLTAFVHGIRSQVEINALLNRFIKENDKYFEEYFHRSEDRQSENPLINILTLINKLNHEVLDYRKFYDSLSNILHPNPTAVKMHVQAKPDKNSMNRFHNPWISFYFDRTFPRTQESARWFKEHLNVFALLVIDFIETINKLEKDFFINEKEERDFNMLAMLEITNQKDFLNYANKQIKEGKEVDLKEYFEILEKRSKK